MVEMCASAFVMTIETIPLLKVTVLPLSVNVTAGPLPIPGRLVAIKLTCPAILVSIE